MDRGLGRLGPELETPGGRGLVLAHGGARRGGAFEQINNLRKAFPTHQAKGWPSSEGGWLLYSVDRMGVMCFGAAWPFVANVTLLLFGVGVLALVAYSLKILFAPCSFLVTMVGFLARWWWCQRRKPGDAEADRLLPPAPPAITSINWIGPAAGPGPGRAEAEAELRSLHGLHVRRHGLLAMQHVRTPVLVSTASSG